jgi:hypothetical protein
LVDGSSSEGSKSKEDDSDDDDDDFDEEDEDEESGSGAKKNEQPPKLKISPLSKLMCSMKDTGNKYLAEYHDQIQDKVEELMRERLSGAKANVWYSFRELEYSFPLLCGGLELRHPESRFEDGRFVM